MVRAIKSLQINNRLGIRRLSLIMLFFCQSSIVVTKTLFQDASLTLLRGHQYEVGDDERTVITFEYAQASDWGDYFMFIDRLESDNGDGSTYMELSPRFLLHNFDDTLLKSLSITTTWEHAENADNFLIGPAIDLNVEGFRYLKLNFYYRLNDNYDDNYQFTPTWAIPFTIADEQWLYDGFIDWSNATDQTAATMHFTSQLKWNAKSHFGTSSNLYFGIEYTYWHNKFGISNVTENNVNLLLKYHF